MGLTSNLGLLKNGDHYDSELRDKADDIPFYSGLLGPNPRTVVELGVGTGRIALPLAKAGHRLTGVDDSPSMLEKTREKFQAEDLSIDLENTDIRTYSPSHSFDWVICPFNTLMHFNEHEIEALLLTIAKSLNDRGQFVVDVMNPAKLSLAPGQSSGFQIEYSHPKTGDRIHVESKRTNVGNKMTMERIFKSSVGELLSSETLVMYFFEPEAWRSRLRRAGFEIVNEFGDYQESPYDHEKCARLLIVCKKI